MKKAIKIISLAGLLLIGTLIFAQDPPNPDPNPNESSGAKELGGSAPIGTGILLLSMFSGLYAVGRTYSLRKRKK